jgi:glutamyl-tRNA reductase
LLQKVRGVFFGPVRVSVMLDSNGANTTAAAAVLLAGKHCDLSTASALVLAATGPVGSRAVRLLAAAGAKVFVASRDRARAETVCHQVVARQPEAKLVPLASGSKEQLAAALAEANVILAAGAPGVELLTAEARRSAGKLQVAIDLSAVPPLGLAGIEVTDKAKELDGALVYGAIGVGGTKMKIHKAAIQRLFAAHDQVLDAEEIYAIGQQLLG